MLKLSKKSEYALMAAKFIAKNHNGKNITAKKISEDYNISYDLVSKVLQNLAKNDLIASFQGARGGYSLTKDPMDITLSDLIMAVEPDYFITSCMKENASDEDCNYFDCCEIRDPLLNVQKKIDEVFRQTKLAHIL